MDSIKVYSPDSFSDHRGELWTSWDKRWEPEYPVDFVHSKFSQSKKNVIRGLHGDSKTWKLFSCVYGEIFVAVVNKKLKWDSWVMSDKNKKVILIPPNYALGHLVKSEMAVAYYQLAYKGEYFDHDKQFTIKWNDPEIGIEWGVSNPILSDRDKLAKSAREINFGI